MLGNNWRLCSIQVIGAYCQNIFSISLAEIKHDFHIRKLYNSSLIQASMVGGNKFRILFSKQSQIAMQKQAKNHARK